MTRQICNHVSLVVDGREVTAPEGTMLHDAAKMGDVEIPVFCYEPKLGDPVIAPGDQEPMPVRAGSVA